jgi:hypothetical protein
MEVRPVEDQDVGTAVLLLQPTAVRFNGLVVPTPPVYPSVKVSAPPELIAPPVQEYPGSARQDDAALVTFLNAPKV